MKISEITISERDRKVFDEKSLDELAHSLATTGQIQPVVVDENGRLVCGHRRILAAKLNGWDEIEAKTVEELDELELKIMEFEENYRRENLTIAEEVAAQERLHGLYEEKYGEFVRSDIIKGDASNKGWTQAKTAELLGITEGWLSVNLKIAEGIRRDPELGKLKSRIAMRRKMEEQQEVLMRKVLVALAQESDEEESGYHQMEDDTAAIREKILRPKGMECRISQGDSQLVLREYADESVDLVLTDPLWAVEFDEELVDDATDVLEVTANVMFECCRIMKPGGHGFMFFAMKRYTEYRKLLLESGFGLNPIPLIWYKPGEGFARDMGRDIRPDYEPCFHFFKNPRPNFFGSMIAVHMEHSANNKWNKAEKPQGMLRMLIEKTTVEGEVVLDPFMGGGSTLDAASGMGRSSIGVDLLAENFDKVVERLGGL